MVEELLTTPNHHPDLWLQENQRSTWYLEQMQSYPMQRRKDRQNEMVSLIK